MTEADLERLIARRCEQLDDALTIQAEAVNERIRWAMIARDAGTLAERLRGEIERLRTSLAEHGTAAPEALTRSE